MELFFFTHLVLIMQYFRQYYSSNRKIDDDNTQVHKSTSTLKQILFALCIKSTQAVRYGSAAITL